MRLNSRTQVWTTQVNNKRVWLTVFIMFAIVATLTLCVCTEAPFEPVDVAPKDYSVYLLDPTTDPQKILTFHPTTQIIDSVEIPWEVRSGITVSADGKRLYLGLLNSVAVVDTDSFSLITELLYDPFTAVSVSPNNEFVAITGDDLYILRTSDYSLIFNDTDKTQNGHFSNDSKSFYCAAGWGPGSRGIVYKVDLSDDSLPVQRLPFSDGGVRIIVPSLVETKWFLYLSLYTWTSAFEVYDVALDSIIFREIIVPGYGEMVMSPDGKNIFYTNPGNGSSSPESNGFGIFDVEANAIDTFVTGNGYFSGSNYSAPPNVMTVTPDNRWLVMLGGSMALMAIYVYDIEKGELVFREDFGLGHYFTSISTQLWK